MKYAWQDLPEKKNCFTVRNAAMINLNTSKVVQYYSANTKIVVVQKCVTTKGTFYRTAEAAHHYLNYAFEAQALGLPNEKAPSAPVITPKYHTQIKPAARSEKLADKQISSQKKPFSEDGAERGLTGWIKRLFGRA